MYIESLFNYWQRVQTDDLETDLLCGELPNHWSRRLEEVHLWAEAGGVEVHTECGCNLWVHISTLGLQLEPHIQQEGGQTGRKDKGIRFQIMLCYTVRVCTFTIYLFELAGGQSSWRRQ